MKKLSIILLGIFVSLLVAEAKPKKAKEEVPAPAKVELTSESDSASYAMGVYMGMQCSSMLSAQNYNIDLFMKAFEAAVSNAPVLMTPDETVNFLNAYEKRIKERENADRIKLGESFLAENAKRDGVHTTASGLQYQVVKMGEGPKPLSTDKVKVHYEGTLLDGTKFDSSIDRGKPAEFPLNRVIKGWTEGLQLMPVGSKFTFYIPYQLGYGAQGAGNLIKPYSTLVFEVELLEIVK
jgi:FKBP-type peptidyl-prolyl cis-trans isomerase